MGLVELCNFCIDGMQIIDCVKETLRKFMESMPTNREIHKPVAFILLDYLMPLKSGIEVIDEVRKIYEKQNASLDDAARLSEPVFVFTTNISMKS